MSLDWIDYKGKKILFIDLKGASQDEMLRIIEEQKKLIDKSIKPVLLLNDFSGTVASKEYMDKAKEYGKEQKQKIKKTALLGIQGMKKFLAKVYVRISDNQNTKVFDTIEEAKEYLVSD